MSIMAKSAKLTRRLVFLLVAAGVFLSTMDSSMINVALPSIMRSFATTLPQTEWVVLMYLLTITVSLLIWGYLADCYGQGRIYLIGMLVFTVGSGACYLAPTFSLLLFYRFVQALGAAMMMAAGPALIKNVYPREQLGRRLGLLGIATSIGLMSGPVISGFLIRYFSWRGIFLVTVPVSLTAFLLGWLFFAGDLSQGKNRESSPAPFDWYGSLVWILLVSLAVISMSRAHQVGSMQKILWTVLFCVGSWLFARMERRHEAPFFPLFLFRRTYGIAMIVSSLSFVVLFVVLIIMPFYMDLVLRLPADRIGTVMMAVPLTLFIVSPVSGWLYDMIGARFLTTTGLAITCLAVLLLSFLHQGSMPYDIAWRLSLLGTGQSIFLSPNTASVLAGIEREYSGITSGMLATSRNIGMLAGVAIAGMAFTAFFSIFSGGLDLKEFSILQIDAFMHAFQGTLGLAVLVALTGGVLSAFRESKPESRIQEPGARSRKK
jgi:EmrB/QacA subfamily drug resistance transporter